MLVANSAAHVRTTYSRSSAPAAIHISASPFFQGKTTTTKDRNERIAIGVGDEAGVAVSVGDEVDELERGQGRETTKLE